MNCSIKIAQNAHHTNNCVDHKDLQYHFNAGKGPFKGAFSLSLIYCYYTIWTTKTKIPFDTREEEKNGQQETRQAKINFVKKRSKNDDKTRLASGGRQAVILTEWYVDRPWTMHVNVHDWSIEFVCARTRSVVDPTLKSICTIYC